MRSRSFSFNRIAASALCAGLAPSAFSAEVDLEGNAWEQTKTPAFYLDDDFFGPDRTDEDYSAGAAVSSAGWGEGRWWAPDHWLGPLARAGDDEQALRSLQVSVLMFTPDNIEAVEVQTNDRPYASLWSITGARMALGPDGRSAKFASLTIGALGLALTRDVHRAVHGLLGIDKPNGYAHQISAGGEPTAKLTYASRRLRAGGGSGRGADLWTTWSASAGYLTEVSVAIAGRVGHRGNPWWSSGAELADYIPAPSFGVRGLGRELTADAGARLRFRAYDAFLQGQFRHSDLRYGQDDLDQVIGEMWVGVTWTLPSHFTLRYSLRAETPELRQGLADRIDVWGSLYASYAF